MFSAILFRPMIPLVPEPLPNLSNKRVLVSAGLRDPIVASYQTKDLIDLLIRVGANVSVQWQNSGHELTQRDVKLAREWVMSELLL